MTALGETIEIEVEVTELDGAMLRTKVGMQMNQI